jgi:hypothetical protein
MFPPDPSREKSAAPSHSCGYKAQSITPPQGKGQQRSRQTVAILASLPGWLTILFAYQNDSAWLTFSLIALALLCQEPINLRSGGNLRYGES